MYYSFALLFAIGAAARPQLQLRNVTEPCVVTEYSGIATAVSTCTDIVLQDIYAPGGSAIDLTKLIAGSTVTFAGTTTFGFTNLSSFTPIQVVGQGVTITAKDDAIIDGSGQFYWDGLGSNGGVPKPNHFVGINKLTNNSVVSNLHIQNYPVHCFSIQNSADLTISNITLDNRAGNAPNNRSAGLPASHNSDGFDISQSTNVVLEGSTVYNQDDCVAVTSGDSIVVRNMYCEGGHGMSIGSVGGKSGGLPSNTVNNILFSDSTIVSSSNGPRIKTNSGTTNASVSNVTYRNIVLRDITTYGIDIQQDYLNGGPTGIPTNGVNITNIFFENVTGTVVGNATDYYVLCGDGSCSGFAYKGVNITGGLVASSCNYPESGCPS